MAEKIVPERRAEANKNAILLDYCKSLFIAHLEYREIRGKFPAVLFDYHLEMSQCDANRWLKR